MAQAIQIDTNNTAATYASTSGSDTQGKIDKVKDIRITNHGKMKSWIANSLAFFEDLEPSKSLTFHTLPAFIPPTTNIQPQNQGGKQPSTSRSASASSNATLTIPRLISTVEIIKRQFFKHLETTRSVRLDGLHQYNEIGTLEALGLPQAAVGAETQKLDAEEQRALGILHALSGRNHPLQSQTPYMRITLSLTERPELIERGAIYQPPSTRKLSKSGIQRAKKRVKIQKALLEAKHASEANADPSSNVTVTDLDNTKTNDNANTSTNAK